jgi:hypothetical protein
LSKEGQVGRDQSYTYSKEQGGAHKEVAANNPLAHCVHVEQGWYERPHEQLVQAFQGLDQQKEDKEKKNEPQRRWYQRNKEKIQERHRRYRKENKKKIQELVRRYHQENKKKIQEQKRRYYQRNKEKLKEYHQRWYQRNKEKLKEYKRRYYQKRKEQRAADLTQREQKQHEAIQIFPSPTKG